MKWRLLVFAFFAFSNCKAQTFEILITEIFADPTPTRGLPEREFLEIYNPTSKAIQLKGFKLLYGNSSVTIPDSTLLPNTFAILCRKGYEAEFQPFGKVIPLANFSLVNDGTILIIKNSKNEDVTFVNYSSEWYTSGREQGYSLEMIDLSFPCRGKENWTSSVSEKGATPGKMNAVNASNPDIAGPKVVSSSLNVNQLTINFDENLHLDFLDKKSNFEIIHGSNEIVNLNYQKYQTTQLLITLKRKLEVGESIKLEIKNLEDCSRNKSENATIEFFNLVPPDSGDIQISEILFNPKSGGADYVELFNSSQKVINLKNWTLANIDSKDQIANPSEISAFDFLIKPGEYFAFTLDKIFVSENYIGGKREHVFGLKKMPAYNDDAGTAILFNADKKEFDRATYTEKMHNSLIANPEGVSLEKTDFDISDNTKKRWVSASADTEFGTPGNKNSAEESDAISNNLFVDPIIFNPYQQNETMSTFVNYKFYEAGVFTKIDILDKMGSVQRHLKNNFLLGTEGKIEWDGKNDSGILLPVGYYVFRINIYSQKTNKTILLKTVLGSN